MAAPRRENDTRRQFKTIVDKGDNPDIISHQEYQEKHGWVSAYPYGHPDFHHAVSAEEQAENVRKANEPKENPYANFKTIPDKDGSGNFLSKKEYQEKHGWVSPYPYGHDSFQHAVTADDSKGN